MGTWVQSSWPDVLEETYEYKFQMLMVTGYMKYKIKSLIAKFTSKVLNVLHRKLR